VIRALRWLEPHLAIGGGTAPDNGVLPDEFSVVAGTFAPSQVLNFGSLAYVVDYYGELYPLKELAPVDNKSLVSPSPLGLLEADLEVLAQQIYHGLVSNPTMSEHHQMFYMLANVHYQIATSEVLPSPKHFWCYLSDLSFGIQNAVMSFHLELDLEHLVSRETP
jgi:hypothetical protein